VPPQGGRKHPHQEFIQIDTTNVLFICGGAFAGLEKIIEQRVGRSGMGFGAVLRVQHTSASHVVIQGLRDDQGSRRMIPEFCRAPAVIPACTTWTRALIRILTEPKKRAGPPIPEAVSNSTAWTWSSPPTR